MATPVRLARHPKARPAAAKAPADRFETFVKEFEAQIAKRLDLTPADSPQCAALFDVYMSIRHAVNAVESSDNQFGK